MAKQSTCKKTKLMKNLKQLTLTLFAVWGVCQMANADMTHRYTFNDGTALDSVGDDDGTLMGAATISGGQLILPGGGGGAAATNFLNLPGPSIAINTYPALTLELWSAQNTLNQTFSMTAVLGGTWATNGVGRDYVMIATTRGDDVSKGAIANTPDGTAPWEDEKGSTGAEKNDLLQHYYALTVSATQVGYYIDGVLQGALQPLGTTTLAGLSTQFAYLGKGVYTSDGTVAGVINEFRISDNALSAADIQDSFLAGPRPGAAPVPEPSTFALIGLGVAGMTLLRRRRA